MRTISSSEGGCAYSDETGRLFQFMPAGDSEGCRPPPWAVQRVGDYGREAASGVNDLALSFRIDSPRRLSR